MAEEVEIELKESDYTTKVPYTKTRKITIAQMVNTPEFKSLEPLFASRILELIRANPSVGILQGGGSREESDVTNLFYANYKKMAKEPNYEKDPAVYAQIRAGKIKWNPEDGEWYRRATSKTVAVPGASWHTGGYAVDLTGNVNLAGKVSKKYNLEQVLGTNETHHFQPVGLPTAKRMYTYIKETYGIDAIKTPLSPDILLYINENLASNVPRQPERIKKVLDSLVKKYKREYGTDIPSAASGILTNSGRQESKTKISWDKIKKITPETIAEAVVTSTTVKIPKPTTTTVKPTTTTVKPTTTTVKPTTTTSAPTTTTSTVAPSTTSTTIPATTTTLPSTTTTSVAPKYGSSRQFEESMPISTPSTTKVTSSPPKIEKESIMSDDSINPATQVIGSSDYFPDPNFYKNKIKEQEEIRKKFKNASYDSDKRGYTIDGKFYTQAQVSAKLNSIEPKIASLKKGEKVYGKYGPAYSDKAKPNAEGIQYKKLVDIAENIEVTDYESSVDSLEAWKKVEDFVSKNKDIRIIRRVDAIVDAGGRKRVRRAIPALVRVKPNDYGQAIADAELRADKYTTEDVVKTTRVQTYGEPGAANAAFTYKTEPIDEPVLTARQEEVAAIKNRQAIPPSVKSIARRQPSEKQVAGITPAVKTPKGSAGKTIEETPTISARQFEEQSMAAYKKIEEPARNNGGGGGGLGTGALKVKKKKEIDWESKFREMFPSQTWMLDIDRTKYADVFTLFKQSVKDEVYRTPEGLARFKTQLEGTSFVRELATTDMVRQVKSVVGDLGFDSMPFSSFLTKAMNLGWEGDTLKQEVYREAFRKDNAGNYVNPTAITRAKASNDYLSISKIGKSYFNTVSDDTVQNVLTGGMTPEDVQRQQRELAKTKYTHLGNLIDQGFSLEDLSSSFKTQAASILERDPNSIDMSQADFEQAFNFGEEGKKRIMTTGEWEIKLRSDPRYNWDKTNNAKEEARSLANSIASAFGKVI